MLKIMFLTKTKSQISGISENSILCQKHTVSFFIYVGILELTTPQARTKAKGKHGTPPLWIVGVSLLAPSADITRSEVSMSIKE